ncbi:ABC-type transport auxiliary lipoprotein family protein [Sphingomonas sp. MMS24-J13]|uniref:ABC-type transport auxiliary lipoprotein family protein n=1 Tax=Sphingomonas sp. MMS24-J13 TaxID=3238686 RepID=UPI00384E11C3
MTKPPLSLLAVAAALSLAGCVNLSPKPPANLMALSATTPLAAGPTRITDDKAAISIAPLTAISSLANTRVLVTNGPTAMAYLKGGAWTAPPAGLFRSLLAETITVRTGRVVPEPRQQAVQPNTRLFGQLSAFGLDGPGFAAVVTFDASIARTGSDKLEARRFSARVPVTSEDPMTVSTAINQAANQVAAEVADWVGKP